MRPNGKGGSHKKSTGTLELGTEEDMLTDCAESIMEKTHMSLRNASRKAILNSTVILPGSTGIQMMNISMRMAGSPSHWSPQLMEQPLKAQSGPRLTFPTNLRRMMPGHLRILWRFQSPWNQAIMSYPLDGIARTHHKFGMHVL